MSAPHLHLMLNHLPVVGSFFALVLLLAALAMRRRDALRLALMGLAALAGLWLMRRGAQAPGWLAGVVLVLALVATVAVARTAWLGGPIMHEEIRGLEADSLH